MDTLSGHVHDVDMFLLYVNGMFPLNLCSKESRGCPLDHWFIDADTVVLEKKLEKYKMVKQGMMQNLLTGKMRLI